MLYNKNSIKMSFSFIFLFQFLLSIKFLPVFCPDSDILSNNNKKIDNNINIKYYLSEDSFPNSLFVCFQKYSQISNFQTAKCLINATKDDIQTVIQILKMEGMYYIIMPVLEGYDPTGKIRHIFQILKESVEKNDGLMDMLNITLTHSDNLNLTLLDYMYNIIDAVENNRTSDPSSILKTVSMLFKEFYIDDIYSYIKANHPELLFDLVEMFVGSTPTFKEIYKEIFEHMGPFKNETMILIIDILSNYGDRKETIRIIGNFLKNNTQTFDGIKKLLKSEYFGRLFSQLMVYNGDILNAIRDTIIEREELVNLFFDLFFIAENTSIIDDTIELFANINDIEYVNQNLPLILKDISLLNNSLIEQLADGFMYVAGYLQGKQQLMNMMTASIQDALGEFFKNYQNVSSLEISEECNYLFANTFFRYNSNNTVWNELFMSYLKKFVFDSPINKGDFLGFDNCMLAEGVDIGDNNRTYRVIPAFIIGIAENPKNKEAFKNTTFYEKYYYISNYCFPFGYKDKNNLTDENAMCNHNDYNLLFKFVSNFFEGVNNTNFETIALNEVNTQLESSDNLIGFFIILILAIPIIIKIIITIHKYLIDKKNKKINKLTSSEKKDKRKLKSKETFEQKDINTVQIKKELPKYEKLLNEYLGFIKNGKELFNFDLNNTRFNNINGITYIKGLIGVSIILTVFGLTYIIMLNLPMKQYGSWHFHKTMKSFIYFIIFIGYRYSPRVLFSCSGYTLIYKFLCYIELEQGYYFLKFLFLQSYKYILLYLVLILFRFSVYEVMYFFHQGKRPAWKLFEHYITSEKNFLIQSFTLLFNLGSDQEENKTKQNLIYYFYMPINEIFFFVFGIILISFGYKYKFRIDYIIIGIIGVCLLIKIILYSVYFSDEEKRMFTTTDYYLSDFGIRFVNPLYNLNYFLIGMYFGLINYSIQKGITDIYKKNNSYKKLIALEEPKLDIQEKTDLDLDSNVSAINNSNDTSNISEEKKENVKENDINKDNNEQMEQLIAKEENNEGNKKEIKDYNDQIKKMPFLISPILFLNFNKKNKDRLWYKILIFLAVAIMAILSLSKTIFLYSFSGLNDESSSEKYIQDLSLEKTISNGTLNILYLFDVEIVIFLTHWILFILFFKNSAVLRTFCNSIYWSFLVKGYFPFILISVPAILCVFYESESVIKVHIYNFYLYSLINLFFILIGIIIFYSIYELPLKRMFKYFLKGSDVMEEEDDSDEEEEEENEKEEENVEVEEDEDEVKSLKN